MADKSSGARGSGGTLDPETPTLTRHLLASLTTREDLNGGELFSLLVTIQSIVKNISAAVRRAGISRLFGTEGSINIQGEEQQKLDVLANQIFISYLKNSYTTCFIVSEEMDNVVEVESEKQGSFVVCFDPLDGSNNIDCLAPIGSIFAVYHRKTKKGLEDPSIVDDVLQPGKQLVAAGYALYGSATMMVLTTGGPVNGYILDPSTATMFSFFHTPVKLISRLGHTWSLIPTPFDISTSAQGEFVLTKPKIQVKQARRQYSANESYSASWDPRVTAFVQSKKNLERPISQRYIGTFIADFHRTLIYGGIFLYPNNATTPDGKLRLLYECNPASFILEHAGGMAIDGTNRILDIEPKTIHDRTQIFLGNVDEVEELLRYLKGIK